MNGWFHNKLKPKHRLWGDCECEHCVAYRKQLMVELQLAKNILELFWV